MHRYFIQLAYNGSSYHGWQVQQNTSSTVQHQLNETLSLLLNEPINTTGCGRTDTGVHARQFYAHFDCTKGLMHKEENNWINKINKVLPPDIAILRIHAVHSEANCRFDAISRTYEYHISNKKDPFGVKQVANIPGKFNIELMNKAASLLKKYEDFSSFSKSKTNTFTNNCIISHAIWEQNGEKLVFTISANRFLRNMVRAIVGTLLELGKEKITLEEFSDIIESKNRSNAGTSVSADGLYLVKVEYPNHQFDE